jgi:pyruvate dehydrogenase E2 component (dihydrolipoamide acetyltransferase)
MTAVTVPQLSISMEDAKVGRWLVDDGDAVAAGQLLVEIETDKATVELEAPAAGRLRIVAGEGAIVPVEGTLAEVEDAVPAAPEPPAADGDRDGPIAASAAGAPSARPAHADARPRQGRVASPAARRLARERGVALASIHGSGPGGRVVARDVAPARSGGDDRLRGAVTANIVSSWQQIPHVHIAGELAAEGVVRARASAPPEPAVTVTDLLVVALARALVEVPELNALLRPGGAVERSDAVHLSLAVATPAGVIAPILRDASSRTLEQIARERRRLVDAARRGTLDGRDLAGGTCTLSNLGAYPVDFFAPVVSGPQVAIVATGRIADRPVAVDGLVGVRPTMWVNVAIDHRAADGEAGGRLLDAFQRQLALLPGGST